MKTQEIENIAEKVAIGLLQNECKDMDIDTLHKFAISLEKEIRLKSIMNKMSEIKIDRIEKGVPVPEFPPLPYAYNALEPHIDARTMGIHYDKYHRRKGCWVRSGRRITG